MQLKMDFIPFTKMNDIEPCDWDDINIEPDDE